MSLILYALKVCLFVPAYNLQGLADTFLLLGMPFDSPQAAELNRQIFETIYFAALRTSMQLAKTEGE